jgi:hypothetical protein
MLRRGIEEAETGRAGAASWNGFRSWPAAEAPEEEDEEPGLCAIGKLEERQQKRRIES